jgi:hypothetical protein
MDWNSIPTIESAGRLGRASVPDDDLADAYSVTGKGESILRNSAALSLGLRAVQDVHRGLMPQRFESFGRGTMAAPNYSTHGDCGGFDYNATCTEPCFGFAPHHMDPFYCATCAEQAADPANNPAWAWHFTGTRGSIQYKDMESNACNGKDAWKWKFGACGDCASSAIYRCHDGFKKYPDAASWDPTICEGLISCDNKLTTCP